MANKLAADAKKKDSNGKLIVEMIRGDIIGIYLVFLLFIYPLFTVNGYKDLLYRKWDLFLYGSSVYLLLMALLWIPVIIAGCKKKEKPFLSLTDKFVFGYLICVMISYIGAVDKSTALWGVETWYMGFITQLLLIGIYFSVSRGASKIKFLKYVTASAYLIVSGIVVLQRFRVDVFGLHKGMPEEVKLNFVTTLGQVTWTSSYISILLVMAIGIFYSIRHRSGKPERAKIFWGTCIFIGFASIMVLNCDSAVIAVAAAGLILIWFSIGNREKILRLMEIVMIALTAAAVAGILERIFSDRLIPIDSIYIMTAKSPYIYVVWAAIIILYILVQKDVIPISLDKKRMKIKKTIFLSLLLLTAAGVILLFILHGKGLFSGSPTENYFRFTIWWGNSRGFIWRTGAAVFADFSWWRKLFGCGPDCFTPYSYRLMGDAMNEFWHNQIVPNVHNEWFNAVINYGIIGGAAYLGIFISAAKGFITGKIRQTEQNPEVFGIGLAVIAYIAHNVLCYQQIIGTPILFVLMAAAESIRRTSAGR